MVLAGATSSSLSSSINKPSTIFVFSSRGFIVIKYMFLGHYIRIHHRLLPSSHPHPRFPTPQISDFLPARTQQPPRIFCRITFPYARTQKRILTACNEKDTTNAFLISFISFHRHDHSPPISTLAISRVEAGPRFHTVTGKATYLCYVWGRKLTYTRLISCIVSQAILSFLRPLFFVFHCTALRSPTHTSTRPLDLSFPYSSFPWASFSPSPLSRRRFASSFRLSACQVSLALIAAIGFTVSLSVVTLG